MKGIVFKIGFMLIALAFACEFVSTAEAGLLSRLRHRAYSARTRVVSAVRHRPAHVAVNRVATAPKQHSHTCPNGHTWWHDDSSFGKTADHTCPKCGLVVWTQGNVAQPVKKSVVVNPPAIKSAPPLQSNCPGGVCPTRGRSRTTWR